MNISGKLAAQMAARAIRNKIQKKPISVSFEITHSCTANCWHCNWGGPIKETRLNADQYAEICRELNPVVCNISGGEPLARGDVYEIVEKVGGKKNLPWMVVVSNSSNLTPERFFRLKDAGMHQLSVSMDFPDDRHSEFRRIPGLFDHMSEVIPDLAKVNKYDDILLNVCITAWNYKSVPDIIRLAKDWGVPVNLSVYSHLRVQDREGLPKAELFADLKQTLEEAIDLQKGGYPLYTKPSVIWKYYQFLTEGGISGCQAGKGFLVVNPDGRMTPCAMVMAYFDTQKDMLNQFTKQNTCDQCYISTRANTEKTIADHLRDNGEILSRILTPWRA
ncbi:MAG: radical SAM protein [Gemmatimonadota bacterium]